MAKYELLKVVDGKEYRRYENGDIRDQNGRVIELHDGHSMLNEHAITSETARDYHKMRKEKILRAVEAGVMRVTEAPDPYAAIGRIVEKRTELAMTDNTRVGNDAARIVLQAMDALQDKTQETTHVERHEYTVDEETLRIVEAMVRARRDGVVVDVESVEI